MSNKQGERIQFGFESKNKCNVMDSFIMHITVTEVKQFPFTIWNQRERQPCSCLMQASKKRRNAEKEEFEEIFADIFEESSDDEDDGDLMGPVNYAIALSTTSNKRYGPRKKKRLTGPRKKNNIETTQEYEGIAMQLHLQHSGKKYTLFIRIFYTNHEAHIGKILRLI